MKLENKCTDISAGSSVSFALTEDGKWMDVSLFEPPRGKTNNVVSEQVRHKPACTSKEKS